MRNRAVLRSSVLALLAVLLAGSVSAAPNDPVAELRDAIAARLLLMQDVARYKWNAKLPIEDAVREKTLIERTTAEAVAMDMCAAYARDVVAAQVAASRALQTEWIARWRAAGQGTFANVPDLATTQRSAIDAATNSLLKALVDARFELDSPGAIALLGTPPHSLAGEADVWAIATSVFSQQSTTRTCP
jgi:chorismate mutase-like protein